MYIKHVREVKEEEVNYEGSINAKIQWLITKDVGANHFAMRRFIIKKDGKIPKHQHDWEHEIYMLSGRGVVGIDEEEVEVDKDMFIYIPPNKPHWFRNPYNEDCIFLCLIPYK